MFERYSHPSRRAVFFARKVALGTGAAEINSMHLLYGLTVEKSSHANRLFKLKKRFPEEISRMRAVKLSTETTNLPLADDCKRIFWYAAQEADRLGNYWINTDHLVLAILRHRESAAAAKLEASGLTIEQATAHVFSSGRERGNYYFLSRFWQPSVPPNIVGQIAAATYVLLIVLLLEIVSAKSC